jgi:hypothetical protein
MESGIRAGSMPLLVVHRCHHVQTYRLPGWLDQDARWRIASALSREYCSHCILDEAWKDLPSSLIRLNPAA